MIDKKRWKWCVACKEPYITCEHCDYDSCSCYGKNYACDKCKKDFTKARDMIRKNTAPEPDEATKRKMLKEYGDAYWD